jgi:hypothetical protein
VLSPRGNFAQQNRKKKNAETSHPIPQISGTIVSHARYAFRPGLSAGDCRRWARVDECAGDSIEAGRECKLRS